MKWFVIKMETLEHANKSYTVIQKFTSELFTVEENKSKLRYTAKYITQLTQNRRQSIMKEIKILKNLQLAHPCILSIHSAEFSDECCLLLYEYCTNGNLSAYSPMNPLKTLNFLCSAVHFLHTKSLIHNNLTVYSIFLSGPIPKISGFDFVTEDELLMDFSSIVNQDYIQGELGEWRAPELSELFSPSNKSDIWSLGQIFFYLITKKVFTGVIPDNLPTQYKDLILMTLDKNPTKRATLQAVIKKIEEKQMNSPRVVRGCGCFPARRFFSCGNSTPSLVRKLINSDLQNADKYFQKLIRKVWNTPGKISKFYNEIQQLQELNENEIRVKAYTLLFIYLQKAPVTSFNILPGVLDVLFAVESKLRPSIQFYTNDLMLRFAHILNLLIKSKLYIVKSHLMNFNGIFTNISSNIKKFLQEPQIEVVQDLLEYWEKLLNFQEILVLHALHNDLLRFVRKVLAEEQNHLLELIKTLIQVNPEIFESLGLNSVSAQLLEKAKNVFKIDSLILNSNLEVNEEILISENFRSERALQASERKFSSNEVKFSPVQLEEDEKEALKSQNFQVSSEKSSENFNSDPVDYEVQLKRISEKFANWNINLNELTLLKVIGKGGSCEVWLGLYQKTQVAIKRQISRQHKTLKEFDREVNFLVNIRHPNLLTFMGICLEDPLSIITEYCSGGTLFSLLHSRKDVFVSWQQKLSILKEIAKGMLFLHSRNFIHRDLKSLNILMNSEINKPNDPIQLKISDFGLTREVDIEEMMTGKIGTSHWMAPEVLSSSKYSTRADVYSFSIVMYEVITREVPYKGKKQEEIRTQVTLNSLRPDLKQVPPSCPSKLITLMTLCWKAESEKRPSFSSILDLLNGINVPN